MTIEQTIDVKSIRRAYAARLREIDRDDPAQLQRLVAARDAALAQVPKRGGRPNMRPEAKRSLTVTNKASKDSGHKTFEPKPSFHGPPSDIEIVAHTGIEDDIKRSEWLASANSYVDDEKWFALWKLVEENPKYRSTIFE